MGLLAFGGVGVGLVTIGGCVIGWQAAGGLAIALDTAVGGCAVALRAAYGGVAFARDYAVGGSASASHANDAIAKQVLGQEPLVQLAQWQLQYQAQHQALWTTFFLVLSIVWFAVLMAVTYRRKRGAPEKSNS